jgi:serine/threonine protein kinase
MADRVGQRFGEYRLTCFLGRGSFGDVYLGEHLQDHTLAVVKVLQARLNSALSGHGLRPQRHPAPEVS